MTVDAGVRCVATGVADGSWLTADWETFASPACTMVPDALRDANTPGRYAEGGPPVGAIRCEGLRPGTARLRVRVRVRVLPNSLTPPTCMCVTGWDVGMRVVVAGGATWSIDGLTQDSVGYEQSCRGGPDVDETTPVTVGADGRVQAQIELGRCVRPMSAVSTASCVFLRGTGVSVEQ